MTVQRPILIFESFLNIFRYLFYNILLSMCTRLVASSCSFFQQLLCRRCLSTHDSIDLGEAWERFERGLSGRTGRSVGQLGGKGTGRSLYKSLWARTFCGSFFCLKLDELYLERIWDGS